MATQPMDAKMSRRFADLLSQRTPGLREACTRAKFLTGQTFPFWDQIGNSYLYNLVTKTKFPKKLSLPILSLTLEAMKSMHGWMESQPSQFQKSDVAFNLMNWKHLLKLLWDFFACSNMRTVLYTLEENAVHALPSEGNPDLYGEDEIEMYSVEFYLIDRFENGLYKRCQILSADMR